MLSFFRKRRTQQPRRACLALESLEDRAVPAVFNVNSLADILHPAPGTVTLRSAISAANATPGGNTINLTVPGTYRITLAGANEDNNASGDFDILSTGGNLSIINTSGGHVVVDGGGHDRVFDINPANDPTPFTVTLQGFTITGGVASDPVNPDGGTSSGGGIRDTGRASLTLNNMVITNNSATADGGGVVFENTVNVPWTLTVNNSVISNNHAGDAGGGIDEDGQGKIFINAGTVITGNTSVNQGAGIWLDAVAGNTVMAVTVNNGGTGYTTAPTVTFSGGGATTQATGTAVITNGVVTAVNITNPGSGYTSAPTITFTGGGTGAAATATLTSVTANLTVTGADISDNTAIAADNFGGGIGNAGTGAVSISDSTIEHNYSGGSGGGFGDENGLGALTVTNSLFLDNTALTNGGGIEEGGPQTAITGTYFVGNTAMAEGGGLFLGGATASVTSTLFRANQANLGGAIEDQATTLTVTTSLFDANQAVGSNAGGGGSGGAIEADTQGTLTITSSLFQDNVARGGGGDGGAINQPSGTLTVSDSQFTGNTADATGAIAFFGTTATVTGSTFNGNQAGDTGAVSLIDSQSATLTNDTFTGNSTPGDGGALNVQISGTATLLNDTITGNTAGGNGGGLVTFPHGFGGQKVVLQNTIIALNTAATGPDVSTNGNSVTDHGGNFIGILTGATGFGAGTLTGNPNVGPLEDNGGPFVGLPGFGQVVLTEALLPGSGAIGTGIAAGAPTTDERGFPRPAGRRTNPSIGAYEPQYAANASANTIFVENLYEVLLGRPAALDPNSQGWVNALNHGATAGSIVQAIETSGEYRGDVVQRLFQRYLHRQAGANELSVFGNYLGNHTLEQLQTVLAGSAEYFQLHGGTNDGFIKALFEDALGRPAGTDELASWQQTLGGSSPGQVAASVFASQEFLSDVVNDDYQKLLGRPADPNGLSGFVGMLTAGATDQSVLGQILGSVEAFGDRTT
jgi:hypothetical protein